MDDDPEEGIVSEPSAGEQGPGGEPASQNEVVDDVGEGDLSFS
jgi:hypothetical protein